MVIMSLRIIAILSLLEVCKTYTPAANPPMLTHASMDVGNIISIVIPESPDENINIEQLTGEFKQQLERIKKQSRASKVEHGLVTLKRVLPEMSREEKRKTLPLIRRVLHGRRVTNSGSLRNWTREASRIEQTREGGQLVRSRSAVNPEERRIYREYEDPANRDAVTTRIDQLTTEKDDYGRFNERTYVNRREEALREDSLRRNDQNRPEELIHHEESGHREERINYPEEDASTSTKIARFGISQDWNNQNWDDQSRGNVAINPETSTTVDCSSKSDRAVRQKEPGNEILQNDKYDKLARLPELRVNLPEEPNADYTKVDQQMASRYAFARKEGAGNEKRNPKDSRTFELTDLPAFGNFPREYDVNGGLNPDCDKRNISGQSSKDHDGNSDVVFNKQNQEIINFERDNHKASQMIIQDSREPFERLNASGFENIVSESVDDFAIKKKRGQSYSEDFRNLPSIKSGSGNRMENWNMPIYEGRHTNNASDHIKVLPSVYEMFGEKDMNPGLPFIPTDQGGLRTNFDTDPKMAASQFVNYGNNNRIPRVQRSINGKYMKNENPEIPINVTERSILIHGNRINDSIFERLKRLFKTPPLPKIFYNSVIILYDNETNGHGERNGEAFTEAGKSQSTISPSMLEPTSSTSHEIPVIVKLTTNSPEIWTTENSDNKSHTTD